MTPPPPKTTTPTPPANSDLPYGIPVPDPKEKGLVYSPYDKTKKVDVRGVAPGKKVRCPYTGKIFLVPAIP